MAGRIGSPRVATGEARRACRGASCMDNLIFSLNAMMPLFFLMVVGMVLRWANVVSEATANGMNKFVFTVGIPVLLFNDLATSDISDMWDAGFIGFCFLATLAGIAVSFVVSLLYRKTRFQGEFVQAAYRSSASLLAIGVMQNIYGTAGVASLMVIGAVPLYNVMAVLVLVLMRPHRQELGLASVRGTVVDVVTNPIILGIVIGLVWAALRNPMPPMLGKTASSIAAAATPVGFIAMGVLFDAKKAFAVRGPALLATFLKLVALAAVTLPVAVAAGMRGQQLVAVLVMMGSATTLSSFVMARNMGHEGTLTSSVVMLSTLLSAFTLTAWLWLLKTMGLV